MEGRLLAHATPQEPKRFSPLLLQRWGTRDMNCSDPVREHEAGEAEPSGMVQPSLGSAPCLGNKDDLRQESKRYLCLTVAKQGHSQCGLSDHTPKRHGGGPTKYDWN